MRYVVKRPKQAAGGEGAIEIISIIIIIIIIIIILLLLLLLLLIIIIVIIIIIIIRCVPFLTYKIWIRVCIAADCSQINRRHDTTNYLLLGSFLLKNGCTGHIVESSWAGVHMHDRCLPTQS